ncbi:MAG: DUF58 domain-containing protein [Bacteroidetes bacterium]|nr:DUF58 domain-containing protein [Bacteroidota bacterium]MBK9671054.1 DUF58 domain-containing protein [Bacteroidota bacterium]MBK9798237.1 DUF58 domain-containing protein [Bacteroidota bacterium]MBP6412973.1 DUF58 domain-containing protein [Bacteroidia bacterium]
MDTAELLKKVRKIEIKSRGLSNQIFSGEYHSAFKGRGMAFSEVREYMPGDDIRTIDWNVTARFNHPYIKVFEEEREMTVMLLVDVSASENFGTKQQLKKELITELCAVIAFSAIQNNDKIGVIFFSDKIEKYIPPKKGKGHILLIIRELIEFTPQNTKTNISLGLQFFTNVIKKRCTAFVISDFIDETDFSDALKIASKKHDTIALRIFDERENVLPPMGLVKFFDTESGQIRWIDTNNAAVRNNYSLQSKKRENQLINLFNRSGVDAAHINTREPYIKPLMNLFKRRAK